MQRCELCKREEARKGAFELRIMPGNGLACNGSVNHTPAYFPIKVLIAIDLSLMKLMFEIVKITLFRLHLIVLFQLILLNGVKWVLSFKKVTVHRRVVNSNPILCSLAKYSLSRFKQSSII